MRKLPAHFAAGLVPVSMPESRLMPHPPCLRLLLLALLSLSSLLLLPLRASAVEGSAGIDLTGAAGQIPLQGGVLAGTEPANFGALDVPAEDLDKLDAAINWSAHQPGRIHAMTHNALWFRFDAFTSPTGGPWFLEIPFWGRGHATLYYRSASGDWVVQDAGDRRPGTEWAIPGRYPTFQLSMQAQQPVRYWLRIHTERAGFSAPMSLMDLPRLAASRDQQQFWLGGYFGWLLFVLTVTLVRAVSWRDRHFGFFALFVALIASTQLSRLGIGAQHLWPDALDWSRISSTFLSPLAAAAALQFVRSLVEPSRFSPWLNRAALATLLILTAWTVLDATVLTLPAGNRIVSAMVMAGLFMICLLIARAWLRRDDSGVAWIAAGFAPMVLMAFFPLSDLAGLQQTNFLTRYGFPISVAISLPILLYALGVRSRRRREANVRAKALDSSDALTGLANHHVLLARLEGALQRARKQQLPCALLGVRLANLPAIATEHRATVVEHALVLAAAQLRGAIGDVDLAARVGNNEFALLLEGPVTTARVQACATQIVAQGLRDSTLLPAGTVLKFHVSAAILPADPPSAAETLRWVLRAAQEMQANGKKAIRALNF